MLATKILLFTREVNIDVLTDPYRAAQWSFTHRALRAAALIWILKRGIHLASLRLPTGVYIASERESIRETIASLALDGRLDKLESVSFNRCSYIRDADLVVVLSACYRSVKSIDIRGCGGLADCSLAVLIKQCTKLESFAPQGVEPAAVISEIFQACRKLRKINLGIFGYKLTDEMVKSVADYCPLLEHLGLAYCSAITDSAVKRVAESCPQLQWISLNGIKVTDATVVLLCNRCQLLKRVSLAQCSNLTDVVIMAVAERLPGITHIGLSGITAITSNALETLASKCRQLKNIHLRNCHNVSDILLAKFAEYCSHLEELNVTGCNHVTAKGATEIATKCTRLKTFYFSYHINRAPLQLRFPHVSWL